MSISILGAHSFILDNSGKVYGFGCNKDGSELGWLGLDSDNSIFTNPTQVQIDEKVIQVSTGGYHTIFLDKSGTIWTCGVNKYGQCCKSELSLKLTLPQICPIQNISIKKITAGGNHSLCIDGQNNVWGMGRNHVGQLGLGNESEIVKKPTKSPYLKNIIEIKAGFDFSLVLNDKDELYLFGDNKSYQLGRNDCRFSSKPLKFDKLKEIYEIEAGYRHCLVRNKDGLWAWGLNDNLQLGNKTKYSNSYKPCCIDRIEKKIISFSGGHSCSAAIDEDGDLWVWGLVFKYSEDTKRCLPNKYEGICDVKQVYCSSHIIVVKNDGSLWSFGKNNLGQLGVGNKNHTPLPTKINVPDDFELFSEPILGKRVFVDEKKDINDCDERSKPKKAKLAEIAEKIS